MGEFFAGLNVAQSDKNNVTAKSKIRLTGVIGIEHGTFPLIGCDRRDKQVVTNLKFDRTELWCNCALQKFASDYVTTLDYNGFTFRNLCRSE